MNKRVYVTNEYECNYAIHFDFEKWKQENPGCMAPCDPEDWRPASQRKEEWPYYYYELDENGKPIWNKDVSDSWRWSYDY